MPKKVAGPSAKPSPKSVVSQRKAASGRELWTIMEDHQVVTIVTSGTSASTMDNAVRTYSKTLKRLAKQ